MLFVKAATPRNIRGHRRRKIPFVVELDPPTSFDLAQNILLQGVERVLRDEGREGVQVSDFETSQRRAGGLGRERECGRSEPLDETQWTGTQRAGIIVVVIIAAGQIIIRSIPLAVETIVDLILLRRFLRQLGSGPLSDPAMAATEAGASPQRVQSGVERHQGRCGSAGRRGLERLVSSRSGRSEGGQERGFLPFDGPVGRGGAARSSVGPDDRQTDGGGGVRAAAETADQPLESGGETPKNEGGTVGTAESNQGAFAHSMRHGQCLLFPSLRRGTVHPDAVDVRAVSRAAVDDVTRSVGMVKNKSVFPTAGGFHETHVGRRRAADEDAGLG